MTSQNNGAGRPRLTVAMIVRDEQEVLAATLESVGAVADEIVVFSTPGQGSDFAGRATRREGPPGGLGRRFLRRPQSPLEDVTGDRSFGSMPASSSRPVRLGELSLPRPSG